MRRVLMVLALTAVMVVGLGAPPSPAACAQTTYCTKLIHSTASAKTVVSVTSKWPAAAGTIYSLARGTSGYWVGVYNSQGYKMRVTGYRGGVVVYDSWRYPTGWYAGNSSWDCAVLTFAPDGQID